jgi:SAM-dependent methyltransferase
VVFLVVQHITDRPAAASEICRVLKPGGRLLIGGHFSGEPTPRPWSRYFPEAAEMEESSLPTVDQLKVVFAATGVSFAGLDRIWITICPSLGSYRDRIRLRTISALERLPDDLYRAGLAALEAEAALETSPEPVCQWSDLLVFDRLPGPA